MRRKLPLIVLWVLYTLPLIAQRTMLVSNNSDDYFLTEEYVSYYEDTSANLDYTSVLQKKFVSLPMENVRSYYSSHFWFKITVKNSSRTQAWLLEVLEFGIPKVVFCDPQKHTSVSTGYVQDFKTRAYGHKNFVFDLSIPEGETMTYLLMTSPAVASGPVMKIRNNTKFVSYANNEYLLLGIYYGLLILIVIYNFFLYISLHDRVHLYYVLYVVSIGLRSLQWDGLGFQYLWPTVPVLNQWLNFAPQLLLISFFWYAINFLELKNRHPFYYKTILYTLVGYSGLYLIDMVFAIKYIQIAYLVPFLVIYGISVIVYRKGYRPARFFILGYSLLIISQVIYILVLKGFRLENEVLILMFVYSLNIGFVIETIIFSIALADKMKILKNDKEKAQLLIIEQLKINENLKDTVNRELEHKVLERTSELEAAKTKLKEQADHIKNMNRLLDLENYKLKSNVKEINLQRGLLKALTFEEFVKTFPEETACFRFIEELKWKDGFVCHKCGGQKYSKGSDSFARRCTKCHYIETIKANTIFHNLKFPTEKAFQIIYLILISEKEVSTYELGRKLELQQKTCWSFRQKIMEELKRKQISKQDILEQGWGILIKE